MHLLGDSAAALIAEQAAATATAQATTADAASIAATLRAIDLQSEATALEAVRIGAVHYLQKPASADDILASFARAGGAEPARLGEVDGDDVPSLDRVEWEHINRVLTDCGGNVSEAARRLGIHRRSLQRKLGKYPAKR